MSESQLTLPNKDLISNESLRTRECASSLRYLNRPFEEVLISWKWRSLPANLGSPSDSKKAPARLKFSGNCIYPSLLVTFPDFGECDFQRMTKKFIDLIIFLRQAWAVSTSSAASASCRSSGRRFKSSRPSTASTRCRTWSVQPRSHCSFVSNF